MRRFDWETRLREWAARRTGDPFQWGDTDCALVCFEAIDCVTGSRLAAEYRGRYHTRRQALKFQRKHDVDLARALTAGGAFRWQGMALVGDLLVHPHPEWPFMIGHVCFGEYCLSAHETGGVAWGRSADALAVTGASVWRAI